MHRLARWHQTKLGLSAFAAIELALAYGFASLAIDRGSAWYYLLTLVLLTGAVHNFVTVIWRLLHEHKTAKA